MNRTFIRIGVYTPLVLVLFCVVVEKGLMAVSTPNYVTDPSNCPNEDGQFPGQKCPGDLKICGVDASDIPQCYDTSTINAPGSSANSNTQYTASLGGGYIIDCFAQPLDSAAPYCDNNGSWLCNRDSSCYGSPVNKDTTCTGAGTFSCGSCRSGYQDCDASSSTCEVQTGVTNYPTGANNNYGASCAAQCDTNYLDCDGSGIDSGNGCEINDGGSCITGDGVSGTYDGCTCVPDKSYFETGTESTYSTPDPLLWGTQVGTGDLLNFSNAAGERFSVSNSGSIKIAEGLTASGTVATESGIVINMDDEAKDAVLVFGTALGQETLKFLDAEHVFEFSDDLRTTGDLSASGVLSVESNGTIGGNLTVGGLINGVDITALSSDNDSHLKVSSGAGLKINIAGGDYRIGGNVTQYAGASNLNVTDDTTNYVYFTSTGVFVTPGEFPTNVAYIPVATVVTSGGAITSVTDRRVFNSNDTERTVTRVLQPEFEGVSYQGDGSGNVGQLIVNHSGGNLMNFYQWSSTRSTLQDYDILLRVTLSDDFIKWGSIPLSVSYRSTTGDSANNKLDIAVFDTADSNVTLSGSSLNLVSATWTTTNIEFSGSPAWTAGSDILVRLRLYAKDEEEMHLGAVKLQYVELLSE